MFCLKEIKEGFMGFFEGLFHNIPDYEGGHRQVDWLKLRGFIEQNKEYINSVKVGLAEDWTWTSGEVWNDKIGYVPQEEANVFAASRWATPSVKIYYKDGNCKMIECWIYGDDSGSYFS